MPQCCTVQESVYFRVQEQKKYGEVVIGGWKRNKIKVVDEKKDLIAFLCKLNSILIASTTMKAKPFVTVEKV